MLDAALDPLGVPLEVVRPCLRKDSIAAERLSFGSQTQGQMPQNQECMVVAADTAAAAAGEDIAVTVESQRMQEVQSDRSSSKDWVVVEELHTEEHHQQELELELELQKDRMDCS